jgi:hypothetical protein
MQGSNSLQSLGEFLGLGGKLPTTGWHTWRGCIDGDPKAWASLKRYNRRDVSLLKGVYEKLLPWVPSHPDMRIYTGKASCRNCGSHDLQMRGEERTLTTIKQRYQCKSCNHWGSVPK